MSFLLLAADPSSPRSPRGWRGRNHALDLAREVVDEEEEDRARRKRRACPGRRG